MGPGRQEWDAPVGVRPEGAVGDRLAGDPRAGIGRPPRRPKGGGVEVVEYRDARRGYAARLVLRVRAGDPPQAEAGDVRNLRVARPADVYQVVFSRGPDQPDEMLHSVSTTHCHEFPIEDVVRCEEEWAPGVDSGMLQKSKAG
jgi:hypothetical protein